jgi:hypothetical protein
LVSELVLGMKISHHECFKGAPILAAPGRDLRSDEHWTVPRVPSQLRPARAPSRARTGCFDAADIDSNTGEGIPSTAERVAVKGGFSKADLDDLTTPRYWQYEVAATFRQRAISAGTSIRRANPEGSVTIDRQSRPFRAVQVEGNRRSEIWAEGLRAGPAGLRTRSERSTVASRPSFSNWYPTPELAQRSNTDPSEFEEHQTARRPPTSRPLRRGSGVSTRVHRSSKSQTNPTDQSGQSRPGEARADTNSNYGVIATARAPECRSSHGH